MKVAGEPRLTAAFSANAGTEKDGGEYLTGDTKLNDVISAET